MFDGELAFDLTLAACAGVGLEVMFPEDIAAISVAKAVCADCPVREECLAGAVARREAAGVWGGELFEEGRVIAVKRPRGRPRKIRPDEVAA
jgi:WhiB family redox-sensing transcriptional regulator